MLRFLHLVIFLLGLGCLFAQTNVITLSVESGAFFTQYKGGQNLYAGIPRDDLDDAFTSFTSGASICWHTSSVTDMVVLDRLSFSIGFGYQQRVMEQTLHFWSGNKDLTEFPQSFNQNIYLGIRSRPNHKVRVDEPYLEFSNHHELYFRPEIIGQALTLDKFSSDVSFGIQVDRRINQGPNPYFKDIVQGGVAQDLEAILERTGAPESIEFRMATYSKQRWSYVFGLSVGYDISDRVSLDLRGRYFYGMSSVHKIDPDLGFIRDLHSYFLGGNTTLGMSWNLGKSVKKKGSTKGRT